MQSPNAIRVARFRANNRRFDYVPASDALTLIERVMASRPGWTVKRTIDALLRTAEQSITGNGAASNRKG